MGRIKETQSSCLGSSFLRPPPDSWQKTSLSPYTGSMTQYTLYWYQSCLRPPPDSWRKTCWSPYTGSLTPVCLVLVPILSSSTTRLLMEDVLVPIHQLSNISTPGTGINPFFTHHQTPDGRRVGPLTLALTQYTWYWYQSLLHPSPDSWRKTCLSPYTGSLTPVRLVLVPILSSPITRLLMEDVLVPLHWLPDTSMPGTGTNPFFIHHQTPDGRRVGPHTPAL